MTGFNEAAAFDAAEGTTIHEYNMALKLGFNEAAAFDAAEGFLHVKI